VRSWWENLSDLSATKQLVVVSRERESLKIERGSDKEKNKKGKEECFGGGRIRNLRSGNPSNN
jgi:hypothetical protein